MALPIIPHELFGADCCGCLIEIVAAVRKFRCNECDAVVPIEDVQRAVMQMESCDATCRHCGRVNEINGFSEVFAFVCSYCRAGVSIGSRLE